MFPAITHIDQVKNAIHGRDEFIIAERDGHSIVNYLVNFEDTFPNPYEPNISEQDKINRLIRRECRGIIFDDNGNIIRRPLNKFFNYGEKQDEVHLFNFNQKFYTLEKLDGSFIAPFKVRNKTLWGTKMGVTDVAKMIDPFLQVNPHYVDFTNEYLQAGYTPIFEFCSLKQRIVISYPMDRLVLLAVRNMITGEYIPYKEMVETGNSWGIDVVNTYENLGGIDEILSHVEDREDIEGFVIRFADNKFTKLKAKLYLMLHRTLDNLSSEKNAIRMILEDKLDDAKPLLDKDIVKKVDTFSDDLNKNILTLTEKVFDIVSESKNNGLTAKEFAMNIVNSNEDNKKISSFLFVAFNNDISFDKMRQKIVDHIIFCAGNKTRMEQNRHMIGGIRWEDYLQLKMGD